MEAVAYTTFESYLEAERGAHARHELVGGRVYALAGASGRHNVMAGMLYRTLAPIAEGRGCRAYMSDHLLRTPGGNAYYPDVMVVCSPAPNPFYQTDPVLIVEVLSPSTKSLDRRDKAVAYAECTSLHVVLLVDQYDRRIEVASPANGRIQDWEAFGPGEIVFTPYGDVNVDELYDHVDRVAPPD